MTPKMQDQRAAQRRSMWLVLWQGLHARPAGIAAALVMGWTAAVLALEAAAFSAALGVLGTGVAIAIRGVVSGASATAIQVGVGHGLLLLGLVIGGIASALGAASTVIAVLLAAPDALLSELVCGALVTVVVFALTYRYERRLLAWRGSREMAWQEWGRVTPLVDDVGRALGIARDMLPPVLIRDEALPASWAHMRAVVLTTGLLGALDDAELAGVLAHELAHWQAGDAAGVCLIWTAALPLALAHAALRWIGATVRSGIVLAIAWAFFWLVDVAVRFVIAPAAARDGREREYHADAVTSAAGPAYREGLKAALIKLAAFEAPRNEWEAVFVRSHPPTALRIDRLASEEERHRRAAVKAAHGTQQTPSGSGS